MRFFFIFLFLFPAFLYANDASLDLKIGQMIMVGFRGSVLSSHDEVIKEIEEGKVGGVILYSYDLPTKTFDRNIQNADQLKSLCQYLSSNAKNATLLIGIDQEGGIVNRLLEKWGFPPTISAEKLGKIDDENITRLYAKSCAETLKSCGINLNFAPVVDVNVNPASPAIGALERSFSQNPNIVSKHASLVIEEHNKLNIITALKHFPGHGSASADSHEGFVDVSGSWLFKELQPYEYLISHNYQGAIMSAHIYCASLDSEYPATLSSQILTDLLRSKMGFNGVIISDDLQMGAIRNHYSMEIAIEKAINAGVDILLFSNQQIFDEQVGRRAHEIIKNLVLTGTLSEKRIDQSYRRIINLKKERNLR